MVTNGYQASHSNDALEQTEYLKLVHRYLSQARELEKLAGRGKVIKVDTCDSPTVAELLRILGFRMRGGCGSEVVLETVNAARAFLTTDSGFPLNELEEALRTDRPFTYDYHPSQVPVLFGPEYWLGRTKDKESPDFIEASSPIPRICRLYLGLSQAGPRNRRSAAQVRLPTRACAPTPTCWISSAACSKSARAGRGSGRPALSGGLGRIGRRFAGSGRRVLRQADQ